MHLKIEMILQEVFDEIDSIFGSLAKVILVLEPLREKSILKMQFLRTKGHLVSNFRVHNG